jgi:hypothetical protein
VEKEHFTECWPREEFRSRALARIVSGLGGIVDVIVQMDKWKLEECISTKFTTQIIIESPLFNTYCNTDADTALTAFAGY